jgi:hypothetical protein
MLPLSEAKKQKQQASIPTPQPTQVEVRVCSLHLETTKKYGQFLDKVTEFSRAKSTNPLAAFGSSDTPFISGGPIGSAQINVGGKQIPLKLRHAHLSRDVCVVYRVHGSPTLVDLYGVFTHKDLGTSSSPSKNVQKTMADVFARQKFNEDDSFNFE